MVEHCRSYLIIPFPRMNIKITKSERIKMKEDEMTNNMIMISFNIDSSKPMFSNNYTPPPKRLISIREGGRCGYSDISTGISKNPRDKWNQRYNVAVTNIVSLCSSISFMLFRWFIIYR